MKHGWLEWYMPKTKRRIILFLWKIRRWVRYWESLPKAPKFPDEDTHNKDITEKIRWVEVKEDAITKREG